MNDEFRMKNDERMTKPEGRVTSADAALSFRLRHSFVIRLSTFVIFLCTSTLPAAEPKPPCCRALPPGQPTDKSLYQLDSTWTNDFDQPVKFGTLQGRVQVVVMFFASCTYACPIIVHDMKRIEAALPEKVRAGTGFTLITIDPERDTTDALHSYRSVHKLNTGRWTLLHGTPDDTLELAALLGVKFKRETSGQFAHSNLITVLSEQGEIIHQQVGLNQDIQPTAQAIERAVGAAWKHPPK